MTKATIDHHQPPATTCTIARVVLGVEEPWPGEAKFCSDCGTLLERAVLYGRTRGVCPDCGRIDFRSPSVAVAALVRDARGRVLMVKRGPGSSRPGFWSIPAGYMDYGEEVRAAGSREVLEETGLEVELGDPIYVATNFHDPLKVCVCIWFAGRVRGGDQRPGSDAVEVGWFPLDDLPELAFETDAALFEQMLEEGSPTPRLIPEEPSSDSGHR